jgi:NitT/TauT family transport system permease protein/taurine transport system permease protein
MAKHYRDVNWRGRAALNGKLLRRTAAITIFVLAWQSLTTFGLVSPIIIASPLAILKAAANSGSDFLQAFYFTLTEILLAICIVWPLGIGAGIILGSNRTLAQATAPILSSIFAIPMVIWYPLLLVWLGIGAQSKIAYGVITGFFPIALATLTAFQHLDGRYRVLARSLGASRGQMLTYFLLPLVTPSIISGLRVGTAFTTIAILVSEMLASTAGIGFWISYNRTLFNTGAVYLGIASALLCVFIISQALGIIERRAGRWQDLEQIERA